jgi:crotonobetainyl-CoA:carnitine CoA-transferase CaiB-like acyl-CoA transferase
VLIKAGVPCGPVLTVPEATAHPQTKARGMIVEIGNYRGTASPIKLSRTPATYRLPPPSLNEHADEILPALLSSDRVGKD